jgi:phenylalanyl-tRNA synthetase alpha chain
MIDPSIIKEAIAAAKQVGNEKELEQVRIKYLGRKSALSQALAQIGKLPPSERPKAGEALNKIRHQLQLAVDAAIKRIRDDKFHLEASQSIDLTIPADKNSAGHLHPVIQIMDEVTQLFWQMGYEVAEGPEVETDWYNFEALNMPKDHPARDMQDTFFLENGNLPRTHTSGVQIRYMEKHKPPIRIISPGKVYRNEDEDARHSWSFYQLEGLVVDKGISMADLKGTLLAMLQGLLGPETKVRLRPNYFPYTEPSVEMDATCTICKGNPGDAGCRICSNIGWLELGGAGMVHPQVLRNVGINPEIYSGFAFGFGPERIAAIKYQVSDIREFWRPNLKFLEQF